MKAHKLRRIKEIEFISSCGIHGKKKDLAIMNASKKLCKRCWNFDKNKEKLGTYCCHCEQLNCDCEHKKCEKCVVQNLEPIDEPILDVIIKMNQLGFKTGYSCYGLEYPGHKIDKERGYVTFNCDSDKAFDFINRTKNWELTYTVNPKYIWSISSYVPIWNEIKEALKEIE